LKKSLQVAAILVIFNPGVQGSKTHSKTIGVFLRGANRSVNLVLQISFSVQEQIV
jgi:hypothetical protein